MTERTDPAPASGWAPDTGSSSRPASSPTPGDGMGLIAYPWLASAVTRNPLLIGLVSVANRLPWLVFSLPAGVITDRVDRRGDDGGLRRRCGRRSPWWSRSSSSPRSGSLPGVDDLDSVTGTRPGLYLVLLARHAAARAWPRCCGTTAARRSCRPSSTPRCWSGPTDGCGARRWWPTPSSGRCSGSLLLSISLRPAVPRRRRLVRGGRRPRVPDRRPVPRPTGRRRRSGGPGGRSWPRACAGCGVTSCCGRWPSSWASSTPSA